MFDLKHVEKYFVPAVNIATPNNTIVKIDYGFSILNVHVELPHCIFTKHFTIDKTLKWETIHYTELYRLIWEDFISKHF